MSSSAKCVAQSKQAKDQLGLIKPTMKAIAALDQPVPLLKVTNTNLGSWNCPEAFDKTTTVIVTNDKRDMYNAAVAILGKGFSQILANNSKALSIWKVTKTCQVSTVLVGSPVPKTYMPTRAEAMEMVTDTLVNTEPAHAKAPVKKPAKPSYLGGASFMAQ